MTKVLFQKGDIYSLTESLKRKVKDAFRAIPDSELDADAVALAARLIEEFSLNVPVIDADKKYALTKQAQVDVSQEPMRHILDRSRPFYIRGTEVRVVIPSDLRVYHDPAPSLTVSRSLPHFRLTGKSALYTRTSWDQPPLVSSMASASSKTSCHSFPSCKSHEPVRCSTADRCARGI